jgi:cytochrome P450
MVNTLQPLVDKNESFDPSKEMTHLTFKIIMESAFEYTPTDLEYDEFVHHLEIGLREFTFKQSVNPLRSTFGFLIPEVRRATQSCYVIRRFCQKVLDQYRANPNKSKQNTLIKLIEENKDFANDAIKVSEISTYIVAGHDTTGFTLSSTLVLLAKHQDICTKARESLKGLSPGDKLSDYVRYCITESNRLIPVAAMGSIRLAGREYTFVDPESKRSVRIPKGANMFLPQVLPNRNKSVFPDPEAFLPDRWAHASKAMTENVLTFAVGNRNCIGQSLATAELNSVVPRLLLDYSFELEEEGELDFFLTLKYSGARLKATRVEKK